MKSKRRSPVAHVCVRVPPVPRHPPHAGTGLSCSGHRRWAAGTFGHPEYYKQAVTTAAQELCDLSDSLLSRPRAMKLNLSDFGQLSPRLYVTAAARGEPGRLEFTELVVAAGVVSPARRRNTTEASSACVYNYRQP